MIGFFILLNILLTLSCCMILGCSDDHDCLWATRDIRYNSNEHPWLTALFMILLFVFPVILLMIIPIYHIILWKKKNKKHHVKCPRCGMHYNY